MLFVFLGQVAVPDHMVGVILGKGGATVIDMQNMTGARIQVSQRGEYIPGTHNRCEQNENENIPEARETNGRSRNRQRFFFFFL